MAVIGLFQFASAPLTPAVGATPLYLPLVLKIEIPTPSETPTATPTATPTPTATATPIQPPPPPSLHITTLSGTSTPEFITITNTGGQTQDMTGWTLVSVVGPQTFNFPIGYVLEAGLSVQVQSYTGAINNPPAILFWTTDAIWNNNGDKAELRDNTSALIDSMCYASGCP